MKEFYKNIQKHQKAEIAAQLKESGQRQEEFVQEAAAAGYEDLFEYDRDLTGEVLIKTTGIIIVVVGAIVGLYLLLG
jgi:hypothetical protein